VNAKVFMFYIRAVGFALSAIIIISNVLQRIAEVSGDVWLSKWTDDTTTYINGTVDTTQRYMRLSVYAGIGLLQGIIDDLY
jgi:hypothetical protein